jgi:hypothetical protein
MRNDQLIIAHCALRIEDAVYTSTRGAKAAISGGGIDGKNAADLVLADLASMHQFK